MICCIRTWARAIIRLPALVALVVLFLSWSGHVPGLAGARIAEAGVFDVIVVGAEPEGIAAAVAAARSGSRVLLVERLNGPGGLLTHGMLNVLDLNFGPRGELLTRGVFEEFFVAMGKKNSFDVVTAERFFTELIRKEKNISVRYNTEVQQAILAPNRTALTGLKLAGIGGAEKKQASVCYARRFIDATQDADLAFMAGVPYRVGGEDYGQNNSMAVTLIFQLTGVDWPAVRQALNKKDSSGHATLEAAWGFGPEMRRYQPVNRRIRVRGLNLGRQKDGTVLVNGLLVTGVNGLETAAKREARSLAEIEIPPLLEFMRQNIPGFGKAELGHLAPELYVRETRHIIGDYVLTLDDVLENRMFKDRIALGSYPIDVQARGTVDFGIIYGKPVVYSIPLRSLIPLQIDNLLVVGRSASYSSLAAGSARVVPIGMSTGQAAGIAASYSLDRSLTLKALAADQKEIEELQRLIVEQGGYLQYYGVVDPPQSRHWAYPYLRVLRNSGAVAGGYHNNWHLDDTITEQSFMNILNRVARAHGRDYPSLQGKILLPVRNIPLARATALRIILAVRGNDPKLFPAQEEGLINVFRSRRWVDPVVEGHWSQKQNGLATRGLAYGLLANTLYQLKIIPYPAIPAGMWFPNTSQP